eukprot:CAMPEP_0118713616 /NCGR_PEP_ID=MMETSP0800-20121206/25641_1 /TAXON_ID=210618 ORGANISM="Striatella unipunctata, Strain CCMP2910" /NCGR_SAMPLE_ID=MMETSP0800 /ASSEMBLY_ACC=CAM_ASM_000638 /LENGTH=30 /DNA_ID= /DNA_START= /DNA_END= /DNA_ORIENTATION=
MFNGDAQCLLIDVGMAICVPEGMEGAPRAP